MKAFIITILDNESSIAYSNNVIKSIKETNSDLEPIVYPAVTPATMWKIDWTWPWHKKKICEKTKLLLKPYKTYDMNKRIAAAGSHYNLWKKCVELNEPIIVCEHDAYFTRKFTPFDFEGGCLGLNDPAKATPKAELFHDTLKNLGEGVHDAPWVMKKEIPQVMAGNSTFIIKPWAAKEIIKAQDEIGWWPNDAITCKQLFPWIKVVYPYYTRVQNIKSTTSL